MTGWELSQGALCSLQPATALQLKNHHREASAAAHSQNGFPKAICEATAITVTARGDSAARAGAPGQELQGSDLQQLQPGPAGAKCAQPAGILTHLGTTAVTCHVPRSNAGPGALLCLGWVFSSPALLLGLPAGAHLGRRARRDRAVSALLSSACPESPLPRLGDGSWRRQ